MAQVSARARVIAITVVAAALVAAGSVAIGLLQGETPRPPATATSVPEPRAGRPPLILDLGVRTDAEARRLREGARLYAGGNFTGAAAIFTAQPSVEARVGLALAGWPDGSLDRLTRLAGLYPRSGVAQLHLALARLWADLPGERVALEATVAADPDSVYAVTADDLLHPRFAPGRPVFIPSSAPPAAVTGLAPARGLAMLRSLARESVVGKLHYGAALQRLGRPRSAARVFAEAARKAPDDPEAQVAAAVGLFDKEHPAEAFSRLGPLTNRFPARATVRFHLGLLLLWSGEVTEARKQLERAIEVEPGSTLAAEARRFLDSLDEAGV